MTLIPYGKQDISNEDIAAVVEVLQSDFLTQGPKVPQFEDALAANCGVAYAVAVNSATSALHIACLALNLQKGDLLWTSAITFVASANCGLYCGADVDFVDIDPITYNMSVKELEKKLIVAKKNGRLPKVVIPVHLTGQPCDMEAIHHLSVKYGFKIIEDASHAIGGRYKNDLIGNCKYSDITVFSFHPVKIITTAEGGAATTNDLTLAKKMALLRSHGITKNQEDFQLDCDGPWYYEQVDLGFNYRMTELQAALGISQLKRLNNFVEQRHLLASRYDQLLKGFPLVTPYQAKYSYSAFHLYVVRLNILETKNHRHVFEALKALKIGVNLHYIPVYRHPYFRKMHFDFKSFPNAERYYGEAISIPIYSSMTLDDQDKVIQALGQAVAI